MIANGVTTVLDSPAGGTQVQDPGSSVTICVQDSNKNAKKFVLPHSGSVGDLIPLVAAWLGRKDNSSVKLLLDGGILPPSEKFAGDEMDMESGEEITLDVSHRD